MVKLKKLDRRLIFVALFAVVGCLLLIISLASSPAVDVQPESANRSGTTTRNDSSASGGQYLQFGAGSGQPAQLAGAWRVDFQDDFSDATKSLTQVWETHPPFTTYYPGSVTVASGLMTLKTGELTKYEWAHVSTAGPYRKSQEPNYPSMKAWREGYFEARLRYTNSEWSWPAFWMISASKSEAWPGENCPANGGFYNSEWDIMENGVQNGWQHRPAAGWFFTNIHKNTTDNTADGYCATKDEHREYSAQMTGQDLSAWHVWGGRWIGDEMCVYLDNVQLKCTTAYDTSRQPMQLNIDIAFLGDSCPSWCGAKPKQLELQVDWVKVWKKI